MTLAMLYAVSGVLVFAIGVYGIIAQAHLVRKILAFNLMGSGVSLLLIALAWRIPELPPDPVPHALVLTGIVVAVSATGFALALISRIHAATGATSLPPAEDKNEQVVKA
jgi:multicomponent Na+:H+ antiporter subunit C